MSEMHDLAERGAAIAAIPDQIELVSPNLWSVRSQSGDGVYLVTLTGGRWKCICPYYTGHQIECKHVVAVKLFTKRLSAREARDTEAKHARQSYSQKWPEYRQAQRAELASFDNVLADLVEGLADPFPIKPTGRPRIQFTDLVYCTIQKVYQNLPLGLAHGLNDRLCAEGHISDSPSRNMPSVLLRSPELTPVLHELVAKSAFPLTAIDEAFAADSSGFCTTLRGDYCREKYGGRVHTVWQKAHVIIGTRTHGVIAVVVTDGHGSDVRQFQELVRKAVDSGFKVGEVSADRGYLSAANCQAVVDSGGVPYILFKENNRGRSGHRGWPNAAWKRMWYAFLDNREGFMEHYYKRENVEAVFSAIKRKLGEKLRSKDPVAQMNELLCKIVAYNITVLIHETFEHGIRLPELARDQPNAAVAPPTHSADEDHTVAAAPAAVPIDWSQENN